VETLTTGRMIPSGLIVNNNVIVETLTTGRMIPSGSSQCSTMTLLLTIRPDGIIRPVVSVSTMTLLLTIRPDGIIRQLCDFNEEFIYDTFTCSILGVLKIRNNTMYKMSSFNGLC
jgi:hypothetical protein